MHAPVCSQDTFYAISAILEICVFCDFCYTLLYSVNWAVLLGFGKGTDVDHPNLNNDCPITSGARLGVKIKN